MSKYVVVFTLILAAVLLGQIKYAYAEDAVPVTSTVTGQQAPTAPDQVSQANKFLAAETSRQIKAGQDTMLQELKNYQDENFLALDEQMRTVMSQMRLQVILAAIGSFLTAAAIVTIIIIRAMQRYSYEKFQEGLLAKSAVENAELTQGQWQGLEQMQQHEWHPQQSNPTVGMQYGQQFAAQQTQMNQWQMTAPYEGAWAASQEGVQREANTYKSKNIQDPMQSPGWSPQEGTQ